MRLFFAALSLVLVLPRVTAAATPVPPAETTVAAPAEEAPVAVPVPSEKAVRHYRSGIALWLFDTTWGLVIPLAFLFTGFSARIRNVAQRLGRKWYFTVALYFILFSLISFVINLPLGYYEDFVRQHDYGLSNQTLAKWTSDQWKGLLVGIVMSVLFGWIPFFFLKKSPRRWWLYTAILSVPLLVLMLVVSPIWIDPLFNDFGPMKDKALETKILTLASRAGIEGGRVFEVNKSVDTKKLNAYVAGLGSTKRIVLWDTIIARLEPRELLAVMGHEMGHYVLGHVPKSVVVLSLLNFAILYVAHRTADGLIARFRDRFGFDSLSDVAALPLLSLLASLVFLTVSPAFLAYVRHNEHEADRFALEITHDNHAMATAFVKLQQDNLSVPYPHPIIVFFRGSHPPLGNRIDFANNYHPWRP